MNPDANDKKFDEIVGKHFPKGGKGWYHNYHGSVQLDGDYGIEELEQWIAVLKEYHQHMHDTLMAEGDVETAKTWLEV